MARASVHRRRRDEALFTVAIGLLGLHAIVDSFVAPEPGTGAADHLLRVFASLAVLAGAGAAYGRLRDGGRAALALGVGILSLEGLALAVADARGAGVRGEDWTGFLLAPVGVLLLVSGLVLLWRSRKPGTWRHLRRLSLLGAGLLTALWVVVPVATAILATHRPRAGVEAFSVGRPSRAVTLRTADGQELEALYVPSRNGAAVIVFPTRAGGVPQARVLARHGYGVLLVDARGYDGSTGDPNLFGWGAARDVDAAVAWLRKRPGVGDGRIGGIGFSVGGEVMLEAAARNPGLRAVVAEGAGVRSVREAFLRGPRGWFALPAEAVRTTALAIMSATAPPASLRELVPRISPRAVFLIHATKGAGGEDLTPTYFRAAGRPKQLWRAPGGHTGAFAAAPFAYERRVVSFFDRALLAGPPGTSP
jgi:fermentation-respiration switch protein FrsA (DUF1100 family)